MKNFLSKTLGPNWETTVWGFLTMLMAGVSMNPSLVSFLPDGAEGYVVGVCNLMTFVFGGAFAAKVKSADVTGGTVPSTKEAEKRVEDNQVKFGPTFKVD